MWFINLFRRLHLLEQWRHYMDAQVTLLTSNIATLQTDVAGILQELKDLQAQIGAGIDAEDLSAITAANTALADINTRLAAALPPTGATGGTGVAGS